MGSRIHFAAGPEDLKELTNYIRSLNFYLVPLQNDQEYTDDTNILVGCFISPVPREQLCISGKPAGRYSDVLDPIIRFTRSVHRPPYLTPGNIYWNNDVPALAAQTKSTFQKIARWIRKNWPKPENYASAHFGPEAKRLFDEGTIVTSLVPGVGITMVPVYSDDT